MINLIANDKYKSLGCKWDSSAKQWVPPKLAKKEFEEIRDKFFSDLIVIEVKSLPDKMLKGKDWGFIHVRMIGGYLVAKVNNRDSGAEIFKDIALIKGKFTSSGSRKNYFCDHDEVILRLEVSKGSIEYIDKEVAEGIYTYEIIG